MRRKCKNNKILRNWRILCEKYLARNEILNGNFAKLFEKSAKNSRKKFRLNFAKISVVAIFIFAVSFCVWPNFAPKNLENAKAESENTAKISQSAQTNSAENFAGKNKISQNYIVKKLEYIQFNDSIPNISGAYINTKQDATGNLKIELNVQTDIRVNTRAIFGIATNSLYLYRYTYASARVWWAENTTNFALDDKNHVITVENGDTFVDDELVAQQTGEITGKDFMYLGNANNSGGVVNGMTGKYYGAKIWKDDVLLLNFVPAARFLCNSSEVEYGFANDLDNDGNLANDEWFGNSGSGKLTGSEEVLAPKCEETLPENPENSDENSAQNLQNDSEKTDNFAKILAPAAGVLVREF